MKVVAGVEFVQEARRIARIPQQRVEIDNGVERLADADPGVDLMPLDVLCAVVVTLDLRALQGTFEGREGRTDDPQPA